MKKGFRIILLILGLLLILFFMKKNKINRSISKDIGVAIPYSLSFEYEDSHGGFFGDGTTLARAKISQADIDRLVNKSNSLWNTYPLNRDLEVITRRLENFNMKLAREIKLDDIDKGYWIYLDRKKGKNVYLKGSESMVPNSNHYSLAIIDDEENMIYYLKFDS